MRSWAAKDSGTRRGNCSPSDQRPRQAYWLPSGLAPAAAPAADGLNALPDPDQARWAVFALVLSRPAGFVPFSSALGGDGGARAVTRPRVASYRDWGANLSAARAARLNASRSHRRAAAWTRSSTAEYTTSSGVAGSANKSHARLSAALDRLRCPALASARACIADAARTSDRVS